MAIYVKDAAGNRHTVAGQGCPGADGKSAYQYAVEGGFPGTEAEFAALMAVRSNPNIMDNWYLARPVNQRGLTSVTDTVYSRGFIDRYIFNSVDAEMVSGGISLTPKSVGDGIPKMFQCIEDFPSGLDITFSVLVDNELFTISGKSGTSFRKIISCGSLNVGVTSAGYLYVEIVPTTDVLVQASKLELGSVQTLAHQDEYGAWVLNEPPPDKAAELLKCQRYLTVLGLTNWAPFGIANIETTTMARIQVPLPTTMRAKPTLTTQGKFVLRIYTPGEAGQKALTPLSLSADNFDGNFITVNVSIQGKAEHLGKLCGLFADNDTSARLIFDDSL